MIRLRIPATRHGRRACLISVVLVCANEMCGSFIMLNYSADIFAQTASTMDVNEAAIVLGALQLLGAFTSSVLVDRLGRRVFILHELRVCFSREFQFDQLPPGSTCVHRCCLLPPPSDRRHVCRCWPDTCTSCAPASRCRR